MNTDKHRDSTCPDSLLPSKKILVLSVLICVHLWLISACSSKPTNLRSLAPADTLVYLETNDLAAALQPIVDNKAFAEVAKAKPDFSPLRGVQLAVVVTGFETKEEKLTEENSIGRVQPHFAAIADTHAWSWQARSFAENQLGEFVNSVYGGGITLDTTPKNGGTYYTWTAEDGRKAYAFVDGSLIFFGNDEGSIDRCLAVKRGQADSILKNPKLPQADPGALAQGYISTDGVAQIANIVGLAMASQTGEEEEVKSFIAGVLPQILRSSVSDVSWTATKTGQGIEDEYLISTAPDVSNVLSETMTPGTAGNGSPLDLMPGNLPTVTLYNLRDPQVAWRFLLLLAQKQAGPVNGKIIGEFSNLLFEPYGIRDSELFLTSVKAPIVTANFDAEGEKPFAMVWLKDEEKVKRAITPELRPTGDGMTDEGVRFGRSDADNLEAGFVGGRLVIGTIEGVGNCFTGNGRIPSVEFEKEKLGKMTASNAAIVTTGINASSAANIASALSAKKSDDAKADSNYFTETRFTKNGIERKTTSDFGLIGSIIAQLAPED